MRSIKSRQSKQAVAFQGPRYALRVGANPVIYELVNQHALLDTH